MKGLAAVLCRMPFTTQSGLKPAALGLQDSITDEQLQHQPFSVRLQLKLKMLILLF